MPIRKGYAFDGWESEDGEDFDFAAPVTQDMSLTARWVSKGYSVLLDLVSHGAIPEEYYGESSVTITQTAPYAYELNYAGRSVELPLLRDVTEGDACYTFAGWRRAGSADSPSPYVQITERDGNYEAVWSEGVREGLLQLSVNEDSAFQGLAKWT